MIDIHTHVLPFVDDGSESYEESIKMLQAAANDGVTDLIVTPHYRRQYAVAKDKLKEDFEKLKAQAESLNIPINLYLGQEIYIENEYKKYFDRDIYLTMNGTDFILAEFNFFKPVDIVDAVFELTHRGYKVIVAHFERYPYADLDDAIDIKANGGLIQVNAASIIGKNGFKSKAMVKKLFERGLVDFVASDIHANRKNNLLKAYGIIKKKYGEEIAKEVFENNAKILI